VGEFAFPVDFVVLDIEVEDSFLILGRPFLNTSKATIDMQEGILTLNVGEKTHAFHLAQLRNHVNGDSSDSEDDEVNEDNCLGDLFNEEDEAILEDANKEDSLLKSFAMIEGDLKPALKPPRRRGHGGEGAKRRCRLRSANQAKKGTKNAQVAFNKVTPCFKEGDKVLIVASPLSLVPGKLLTR
ncbi:hypothetical protein LINGRAPRIM_LOCUS3391, partial [Linum grandiflorum]